MGFLAAILGFLGSIVGPILKIFIQTPPAVAVEDQKLGQAQVTAATDEQAATTDTAIAQAAVDAPKTQDELDKRLEDGTF